MSLLCKRLGSTSEAPHCLEVQTHLLAASTLLLHIERLPGVRVIAKKSWVLTDDFEAYFEYGNRLWVVETPFSLIEVSLLGKPVDEDLFATVESHVRGYPWYMTLLAPVAVLRYVLVRFTPSRKTFHSYGLQHPAETRANAA
jgi:hypothetical protein